MAVRLKVKIAMWLVILERLPTGDYFHKRHIRPLSPCVFSGNPTKSTSHIFLLCPFTNHVWFTFTIGLNLLYWPTSLHHTWEDWRTNIPKITRKYWDINLHAVIWSILLERNAKIFKYQMQSTEEVYHRALFFADLWRSQLTTLNFFVYFLYYYIFPSISHLTFLVSGCTISITSFNIIELRSFFRPAFF